MKITLKDNVVAEVSRGTTVLKVAESISTSLARNAICGRVNGKLVDLNSAINKNCKLEIITNKSNEAKNILNHTACHILAQAVKTVCPSVKLLSGDGDVNGFYYDFEFKTQLTEDDLQTVEEEMRRIANAEFSIEKSTITKAEAINVMSELEESLKIERLELSQADPVTLLSCGEFVDICDKVLLKNTSALKFFTVNRISEVRCCGTLAEDAVATRISGSAFFKKEELEKYIINLETADSKNHIKIGKELKLFSLSDEDCGRVFWLPKGWKLYRALLDYWRETHECFGYSEINTPSLESITVAKRGEHLNYCASTEYSVVCAKQTNKDFVLRAVNCPGAMKYYKQEPHSEYELPLRISECSILYREMQENKLDGLFNLNEFRQDDAHNFVTYEQVEDEFAHLFDLADQLYKCFGLNYSVELLTRPSKHLGDKRSWDMAEKTLVNILNKRFGEGNYAVKVGEGSYFGPKIDIVVQDAKQVEWRTGSFQLDVQLPKKLGLVYTAEDGELKNPVVLHRTIYGSIERFIGLLIERFAGEFPFFIAPIQVKIVCSNKKYMAMSQKIASALRAIKVRCELVSEKFSEGFINSTFKNEKVPYIISIDANLVKEQKILVAVRGNGKTQEVPIKNLLEGLDELNKTRLLSLTTKF